MKTRTYSTIILVISLILIIAFFILAKSARGDNLIPREVLFGDSDKLAVTISPDGKKIGYLSAKNNILNICVADRMYPTECIPITNDKKLRISNYFWAYDNKHILYLQDNNGDEDSHIYSVNIETSEIQDLTPFKKTKASIVKLSEHIPNKIVIASNDRDRRYFDLYEADINSGKLKLLHENKQGLTKQVVSDDNGQYTLSFATKFNDNGSKTIFKVEDNMQLSSFLEVPVEDIASTNILALGETSNVVYIESSIGRNTTALIEYNKQNKTHKIIHHALKTDIRSVLLKPRKKNIQIVYNEFLKVSKTILDDAIKEDLAYLENFNKTAELKINARDLNDEYWIISYSSDTKPREYFLYNKKDKKLEFLFTSQKKLEQYSLASMWPMVIKSRDGLDLVSYLTIPREVLKKGVKSFIPTKPVPLIIYVHGGPKGTRDRWGLNNVHQWLSNRGYAVLSVNYRASSGFGKLFSNAGDGQWSKKMQYDLIDAVRWAINNKITTKNKVAIFGASYGGYAALVGLTFTPNMFACAVDVVGPSNLITLMKSTPSYWAPRYKELIKIVGGDPATKEGRKFLESISPITHIKNIKKPLLIAQGANDPRVKRAESDQIVEAMRNHKIPVIYLLYPNEGHGFVRPENKMSFFAVAEQFFKKNLGGKAEPIGKAFKGSSIEILEGAENI